MCTIHSPIQYSTKHSQMQTLNTHKRTHPQLLHSAMRELGTHHYTLAAGKAAASARRTRHAHTCTRTHTYIHSQTFTHRHTHKHTHKHTYTRPTAASLCKTRAAHPPLHPSCWQDSGMCKAYHTCTHMHVHTHTHTHTHAQKHTHTRPTAVPHCKTRAVHPPLHPLQLAGQLHL